ncbi:MAG: DUF4837 family protein, partial [Bacteroidales bacterium]|nr:DUF4837 family protein [Bacteroidales bacterium]
MKAYLKIYPKLQLILAFILTITLTAGCKESGIQLKQSVSGKAGEIVIVANKVYWESEPGTLLRNILACDYPLLPQKEPSFTLINIPESAFTNIFQIHRNIIIVKTDEKLTEPKFIIQEDVWSAPQTVITIAADNITSLSELIEKKRETIFNTFEQSERNRVIRNSKKYEERSLRNIVAETFGGSPYFPNGYSLKKKTDDFIWISYETTYTNQSLLIYKYPVKDSTTMTLEGLIAARNEVMEKNVPGMLEGSYMTTTMIKEREPQLKWVKYIDRSFGELRGLWEVQNDYMGGPFVQHAFYDKSGKNIIVVEGFVYAPRYDKRNYLRQVESIIYSFDWAENFSR